MNFNKKHDIKQCTFTGKKHNMYTKSTFQLHAQEQQQLSANGKHVSVLDTIMLAVTNSNNSEYKVLKGDKMN